MALDIGDHTLDMETGEISESSLFNAETGEYEGQLIRRFKVPSSYYIQPQKHKPSKHRKHLKAHPMEIELIHAAIFLLPTMILFHPILAIVACIVEYFLHTWSHKKNKELKDSGVYFQSPLHPIVREFCGRCKIERESMKITKMQDIKHDRYKKSELEYIKRVVT